VRALLKGVMALMWSSAIVIGGLATLYTPALTVSFWRQAVAVPLMALIARAGGGLWPLRSEVGRVFAVGVLLQGVQFAGIYMALGQGVPAGLAALLVGSSPMVVAIAGTVFYGERMRRQQWFGSALGLAGVVCAVADELHGTVTAVGLLLVLGGLCGLTGGTLIQRHHPSRADPRCALSLQLLAGAAFLTPLAAIGPGFHVDLEYRAVAPIAWLVVPSIFGTLLFYWLLKQEGGGEATSFLYLVPSVTAIAAVPILGQSLAPGVVFGLVLSLIGLNLVGRADRYEPDPVGQTAADPVAPTAADR
jgi:drug/metabolite transporter (DMT)-like permease